MKQTISFPNVWYPEVVVLWTITSTACESLLHHALYRLIHTHAEYRRISLQEAAALRAMISGSVAFSARNNLKQKYDEPAALFRGIQMDTCVRPDSCPFQITSQRTLRCQNLSAGCFKRVKNYVNACEPSSTSMHTSPTNFSSFYRSLVMKHFGGHMAVSQPHTYLVKGSLNWVRNSRHIRLDRVSQLNT